MHLSVRHLTHRRHFKTLFADLNFDLAQGECLQIKGANGAGKTTLLRMLAGLLTPTMGEVIWSAQTLFHYIGHQNFLRANLTVEENLKLISALKNIVSPQINFALERVKLHTIKNRKVNQLSQGQQRRVSLASLLLTKAPVWLLDEPTTALDTASNEVFTSMLDEHLRSGSAIIATHQTITIKNETSFCTLGALV